MISEAHGADGMIAAVEVAPGGGRLSIALTKGVALHMEGEVDGRREPDRTQTTEGEVDPHEKKRDAKNASGGGGWWE